jgi:hypothetical protein
MSDVKRVTVEKFDGEGNLVERIITEYDKVDRIKPYTEDSRPPYLDVLTDQIKYRNNTVHVTDDL